MSLTGGLDRAMIRQNGVAHTPGTTAMDDFDQILISAYTSFGEPVDRIAAFLELRSEFLARPPVETRNTDGDSIIWRLFQLRKHGKLSTTENAKG
jgi:hypothetical protein